MRNTFSIIAVLMVVTLLSVPAVAQKGTGNTTGIAASGEILDIVTMSGKIVEIHVGPCENTTGKYFIGVHLIILTKEGLEINLHIGPADAVAYIIQRLSLGQTITFEAFRTDELPENAYDAKTLIFGNTFIELRDESLHPFWA